MKTDRLYAVENPASVTYNAVYQFHSLANLGGKLFAGLYGKVFQLICTLDIGT